jgi:ABC-type branched-subunit amino acid transport system permease subunit
MRIMTTAGLYALLTIGVVIVLGQAGQLSFGHSAFYGIGASTATDRRSDRWKAR